jgi:hypothetical protein
MGTIERSDEKLDLIRIENTEEVSIAYLWREERLPGHEHA